MKTFRLVEQEREHHAVSLLCAVLRVTRQGYYAWRRREACPGPRRQADAVYCGAIMRLYTRSRETYGAPRITGRLRIEEGIRIGQKRAARLMRELGIKGVARGKKQPRTTIPVKSRRVSLDRRQKPWRCLRAPDASQTAEEGRDDLRR